MEPQTVSLLARARRSYTGPKHRKRVISQSVYACVTSRLHVKLLSRSLRVIDYGLGQDHMRVLGTGLNPSETRTSPRSRVNF